MTSKHHIIYREIADAIRNGTYKSGTLLPTELEFCKSFKVSRPTIAKALDRLKEEGAIERIAGFGTRVLESKLTKQKKIGLLIPRLGRTEIFEPIVNAMSEACENHFIELFPPPHFPLAKSVEECTKNICSRFIDDQLDGVIFTPVEHVEYGEKFNQSILHQLDKANIAVVLLDRDVLNWPQQTTYDMVGIDNIQAGFVVTHHMLEKGCTSLLFLTRPKPAMTVQLRIMGCREALLSTGLSPDALRIMEIDPAIELKAKHLLQHNVDGLICANDATAAIALRLLVDANISIPEQICVAGFDDVKYAPLLSIPLTTYHQPCIDIGNAAIDAIIHRLENPESAPHRITLQGKLITRASTEVS